MRSLIGSVDALWLYNHESQTISLEKGENLTLDVNLLDLSKRFVELGVPYFTCELFDDKFLSFLADTGSSVSAIILADVAKYARIYQVFSSTEFDFSQIRKAAQGDPTVKRIVISEEKVNQGSGIQNSLLPPIESFRKHFSAAEILYKPLNDVGGDFFWIAEKDDQVLVVLGDCVGHGMEGALVSMSVMSMLKQAFRANKWEDLSEIVYKLYTEIEFLIETESALGLDTEMGFALYDKRSKTVEFVGTGLNLMLKRERGIEVFKSRFSHLAKSSLQSSRFSVSDQEKIILCTDGITDTFDANDEKKLGSKRLQTFLEDEEDLNINKIKHFISDFSGDTLLLDDQTLLLLTI